MNRDEGGVAICYPIRFGNVRAVWTYKNSGLRRATHLPGRGLSVISKANDLGKPAPLHSGPGDPSISLRGACTS
jgi:hypothetical protein